MEVYLGEQMNAICKACKKQYVLNHCDIGECKIIKAVLKNVHGRIVREDPIVQSSINVALASDLLKEIQKDIEKAEVPY